MRRTSLPVMMLAAFAVLALMPSGAAANSFFVTCTSSHIAKDDPIVFPGQPGRAHRHEFFGARSTNAASTTSSLAASRTTCADRADTAAYWVPTLEVRGIRVTGTMRAYYQRAGKRRAAAPPQGLRMIAGDMHPTQPQATTVTAYTCVGERSGAQQATIPRCARGTRLGSWVKFPDCWDGRRLDSGDHKEHMAYSRGGACPPSHPAELMRVAVLVTWPVRPASTTDVRLAGDMLDPIAMHGDFWNAWQPQALAQLRWSCIEVAAACGEVTR